jgi:hypothetical protein
MKQSKRVFFSVTLAGVTLFTTLSVSLFTSLFATIANPFTTLPCLAAGEVYPVDVPKKYPVSFAAYKKILPKAWHNAAWVYKLEGTAEPVRTIDFSGRKFVLGHVCKPHDCADNQLTFLLAVDGSAAYAQANSLDLTQGKVVIVGKPDAEAKKILAKGLD